MTGVIRFQGIHDILESSMAIQAGLKNAQLGETLSRITQSIE